MTRGFASRVGPAAGPWLELRRHGRDAWVFSLLAVVLAAVALSPMAATPEADAQGSAEIEPNLATSYLGPEVVISGRASDSSGIDSVTITVRNTTTGQYLQPGGGFGSSATQLDSWQALLPPPAEYAVSWRVPISLPNGTYETTITANPVSGSATTSGPHDFSVRSTPIDPITLVAADAEWSYFDQGTAPADSGGAAWNEPAYNVGAWPSGRAELGYGDGSETTTTNPEVDGAEVVTNYFRHEFTVADLSDYSTVDLAARIEDGAVIYLNGLELGRVNMSDGAVNYDTRALFPLDQVVTDTFSADRLVVGQNVIAVEVHRALFSSEGISFDLELEAQPAGQPLVSDNTAGTYVLAAGDMAKCTYTGDEAVADQMDKLFDTDAGVFLGLGDLAYEDSSNDEFNLCYDPTIGRHKDVTWPSPGNHEHNRKPNARNYRLYFEDAAAQGAGTDAGVGLWYSFDLDENWHVIALDSDCRNDEALPGAIDGDGCAVGSEQEQWLRADLEANSDKNLIAFWHHPPYTNNHYTDHAYTWPLWKALTEYGVDITLHGHEHHYERYHPLNYWGEVDSTYGAAEFIVGSGGTQPRYWTRSQEPESAFRGTFDNGGTGTRRTDFGVLQLWLRPDGYSYRWESIYGHAPVDAGEGTLAQAPPKASISGRVVDDLGTGLAGFEVCITASKDSSRRCTTSAADGSYRFDGLLSDTYTTSTSSPAGQFATAVETIVLNAPTDAVQDLVILPLFVLDGTVTDEVSGDPIPGAQICLSGDVARCIHTSNAGTFRFIDLDTGAYHITTAAFGYETECFDDKRCQSPTRINLRRDYTANIALAKTTVADVNCDAEHDLSDAWAIASYLTGRLATTGDCGSAGGPAGAGGTIVSVYGDVNSNGSVSTADANMLLACLIGETNSFCP